jgi:hypothetical protein
VSATEKAEALSRTRWAELHVENFVSPAFVSEFVFRSPQTIDGKLQREVADLLITRDEQAILVSQKCQEDPDSRKPDKVPAWAQKQAAGAVAQLRGALRRVDDASEIWCDHPRRGRVAFSDGLPRISHAIAAVEVFQRVDLQSDLPLEHQGTPISYLSVSDFLNLTQQLRTVPEVIRYLDERRSLPEAELRIIGAEQVIFDYYLLLNGSLAGFTSRGHAAKVLADRGDDLYGAIVAKAERDGYARALEHVADQLSGRHPQYADGLTQAVLDRYEPTHERRTYLKMQEVLAGMQLAERAELGRMFEDAIRKRKAGEGRGFTFAAARIGSQPDWVFVLGSFGESSTFTRERLLSAFDPLTTEAMKHYSRSRCLVIVDRDGKSYEVAMAELMSRPPAEGEYTSKLFGSLKTFIKELHFRPATEPNET